MTNYERIKAMSVEEMFVAIQRTFIGKAPWCDHHCELDDGSSCSDCLMAWLESEVQDENR